MKQKKAPMPFWTLIAQTELGRFEPPTDSFSEGSDTTEGALSNLELIISNSLGVITVLAGVFFIFYFIMGAFQILSAGGDSGKVQSGQQRITQAVLGLVILVAAYAIIGLISTVLGLSLLNPAQVIQESLIPGGGS